VLGSCGNLVESCVQGFRKEKQNRFDDMIYSILASSIGHRGPGLLVLLIALVFILSLDKIIKLIVYITDKIAERKKNKRE
jgi:hypothetical protein